MKGKLLQGSFQVSNQALRCLLLACLLVGESLRARTKQSRKRLHIGGIIVLYGRKVIVKEQNEILGKLHIPRENLR